jgi:AcrR family transcriptional regulator
LLSATIAVLDDYGYDRLTIDEVAARAHASKATIYRRWPSKAILVIAAMAARVDKLPFADTMDGGPLRVELLQIVRTLTEEALEFRATIGGLIGEAIRSEELRASIEEHFVKPRRQMIRDMPRRRQAAGDIQGGVDLDLVGQPPQRDDLPAPADHLRADWQDVSRTHRR